MSGDSEMSTVGGNFARRGLRRLGALAVAVLALLVGAAALPLPSAHAMHQLLQ